MCNRLSLIVVSYLQLLRLEILIFQRALDKSSIFIKTPCKLSKFNLKAVKKIWWLDIKFLQAEAQKVISTASKTGKRLAKKEQRKVQQNNQIIQATN